jgi:hypothetical protein
MARPPESRRPAGASPVRGIVGRPMERSCTSPWRNPFAEKGFGSPGHREKGKHLCPPRAPGSMLLRRRAFSLRGHPWRGPGQAFRDCRQDWRIRGQRWRGCRQGWRRPRQRWRLRGQPWPLCRQEWRGRRQAWRACRQAWRGRGQPWRGARQAWRAPRFWWRRSG